MSWLILRANRGQRQHHVFDSSKGLSNPRPVDGDHWAPAALACGEDAVHRDLAKFSGHFKTYKG